MVDFARTRTHPARRTPRARAAAPIAPIAPIALLGALALATAAPARADLLGNLVNQFMHSLVHGDRAPGREAEDDWREIPAGAVAGTMEPPDGRRVEIDGTLHRLSPGCQIRDLNGRIVLPAYIDDPIDVRYVLDNHRQVHRIWLMAER